MSAFTTINEGDEMFKVSVLNEVVNGVAERLLASGTPSLVPDPIVAGDDVQLLSLWVDYLQKKIDTMCLSFYDSTGGAGKYSGYDPGTILPFTLAEFRAAAGLNASGFKRVTSYDPLTVFYGYMQAGDIIGPWIMTELQNALKVLKWTSLPLVVYGAPQFHGGSGSGATAADAWADAVSGASGWNTASWLSDDVGIVETSCYLTNRAPWVSLTQRHDRQLSSSQTALATIPCAIDTYWQAFDYYLYTFNDIDGLGLVQDKMWYGGTFTPSLGVPVIGPLMNHNDNDPLTILGGAAGSYDYALKAPIWIGRWTFTNM